MNPALRVFKRLTAPFVWRLANFYDLKVMHPVYGQFPLKIAGGRGSIPKSAVFNTRSGSITVGPNVVFGEDVHVLTGKHLNIIEARQGGVDHHHVPEGRDIAIGAGCYVGSGAILIGPLTVGEFAVIGAGAVVTKDVEPYTFVAGNPARIVRRLK